MKLFKADNLFVRVHADTGDFYITCEQRGVVAKLVKRVTDLVFLCFRQDLERSNWAKTTRDLHFPDGRCVRVTCEEITLEEYVRAEKEFEERGGE